jgi:small multidrug resistance pump
VKSWLYLSVAVLSEVIATSALKASDSFTRLWPSLLAIVGYGIAFYFLTLTLRTVPVGIAYAIWSGIGIVLISVISWFVFGQRLDAPAIVGIGLVVSGVVVLNLFSKSVPH